MEYIRKHKKAMAIIMVIVTLAMIGSAILPYFIGYY